MSSSTLSNAFQRVYCDPAVFASFSTFHPISFARVLPFQAEEPVVDDPQLLDAEEAYLADPTEDTQLRVVEAYARCGLLSAEEAANLKPVIDFFAADFFELMGEIYANAQMFRCALRWYRELIQELETNSPGSSSDNESVYASVGYCLYSLGLFEEAIAWSKACIGPRLMADTVNRALINYEARLGPGVIRVIERSGPRTKYTVTAVDPAVSLPAIPRLKTAMKEFAPFADVYMDWATADHPCPEQWPFGYPFQAEFDGGSLVRHKMNLIFATCGHADALIAKGYLPEAKRLLQEAAMIEPEADCLQERLKSLP